MCWGSGSQAVFRRSFAVGARFVMSVCEGSAIATRGLTHALVLIIFGFFTSVAHSQPTDDTEPPPSEIGIEFGEAADENLKRRIESIFSEIEELVGIEAVVNEGVVTLRGSVANEAQAQRAVTLASRVAGVVTVQEEIERTLGVAENISPLVESLNQKLAQWVRALPLVLLAGILFAGISYAGHRIARWESLWKRVAPNVFLADLLGQTVRILAIFVGFALALNILGAGALMGAILGGAGVFGLAVGFAVKDTLENYISSILLSIRQPFRANDHVVIGDQEGRVIRLTSRATILMTLDGNHLRIPNAVVFKAVILNYSRNPQRRFDFELGVDAADDPLAAIEAGKAELAALDFVLDSPPPEGVIRAVGDSNIVISFRGWIDQGESDFSKARSLAIRGVKDVLEAQGFSLPEPIYRLKFDGSAGDLVQTVSRPSQGDPLANEQSPTPRSIAGDAQDIAPDAHLDSQVARERAENQEGDLLSPTSPME